MKPKKLKPQPPKNKPTPPYNLQKNCGPFIHVITYHNSYLSRTHTIYWKN